MELTPEYYKNFVHKEDDYGWLELDEIPVDIHNPFVDLDPFQFKNPVEPIARLFMDYNNLYWTTKTLLGIELLPYQMMILETLWTKKFPLLVATRGAAKTTMIGVYALLRMILNPGCKVVITSASFRQAKQAFEYMESIWNSSGILRDIAGKGKDTGPKKDLDRCTFRLGNSQTICIPTGDGSKIRGLRGNYIVVDECQSTKREVISVVIQGFGVVSKNPVEKVKRAYMMKNLRDAGIDTSQIEMLNETSMNGNQIVYTGTCPLVWNHFSDYYTSYKKIIMANDDKDLMREIFGEDETILRGLRSKDFAILQIPYDALPEGMLDDSIVSQAKATLETGNFVAEYGACFIKDTAGFYRRSVLESATCNKPIVLHTGTIVNFTPSRSGEKGIQHVIGVDPAAADDNAAISVVAMYPDHRRILYCWTVNKKKFLELKKQNITQENDYYKFIARKIRQLMERFQTERIAIDQGGGGTAIVEALGDPANCLEKEKPVYEIIDPDNEKDTDYKDGIHIVQIVKPTAELNMIANHGMLKDFQTQTLLFPITDSVEKERALHIDQQSNISYDTYEELIEEIEELKNEITTIVCTATPSGKYEKFDTPVVKGEGTKKGYLRKDRFSALLYANFYARTRNANGQISMSEYVAVGGNKEMINRKHSNTGQMYAGPGVLKGKVPNSMPCGFLKQK
jgi:hypothetical protein